MGQTVERDIEVERYTGVFAHETIKLYLYFFVGFLVPFSLGHPQYLVGTVVNATLILAAIEMGLSRKTLPLLFAPSLGVLARGIIFGPLTPFLLIMLPFIWIGNALLVFVISQLYQNKKKNYGIALGTAAGVKTGFLFSAAFALVSFSILPPLFLATMGLDQLLTAVAGGLLAIGLHKAGITKLCF